MVRCYFSGRPGRVQLATNSKHRNCLVLKDEKRRWSLDYLFQLSIITKDNRDRHQVAVVLVARELAHYRLEERLYGYKNDRDFLEDIKKELERRKRSS